MLQLVTVDSFVTNGVLFPQFVQLINYKVNDKNMHKDINFEI